MNNLKGILVRVGIDSTYGKWNAPVEPDSMDYFYLPIPENSKLKIITCFERRYGDIIPFIEKFTAKHGIVLFKDLDFPGFLLNQNMHLDPDFEHLTYGDNGERRGKGVASLEQGDFIVFYSGLNPSDLIIRSWFMH